MPHTKEAAASTPPTGSLRSLAATYFALLQSWEFGQAHALAAQLPWRKLSSALQHLSQVEAMYHSGAVVEGRPARVALLRRIDAAAAEVEACLGHIAPATRSSLATMRDRYGNDSESPSPQRFQHLGTGRLVRGGGSGGSWRGGGTAADAMAPSPLFSHSFQVSPGLAHFAPEGAEGGAAGTGGRRSEASGDDGGDGLLGGVLRSVGEFLSGVAEQIVTCGDAASGGRGGPPKGLDNLLGQHGLLSSPAIPRFTPGGSRAEIDGRTSADGTAAEERVASLLREFLKLLILRRQVLFDYDYAHSNTIYTIVIINKKYYYFCYYNQCDTY